MALFLRGHERRKDGKTNTYWSLVENRRCAGGRVVQRHVLYLGKLTPAQELSWEKTAAQLEDKPPLGEALPGFASERELQRKEAAAIAVRLKQFRIERPRQWGACWVALAVWNLLKLSEFWSSRLPPSREGTRWLNVLITLVIYRLLDPGSEWRLHRQWYEQTEIERENRLSAEASHAPAISAAQEFVSRIRIHLDEDCQDHALAKALQQHGIDAKTTNELGLGGVDDERQCRT